MDRDLAITFAGGGSRAFYQLGFLERWADELMPRTAAIAGCSAGAAMATLLVSGRVAETRTFFAEQRRGVRGLLNLRSFREEGSPFPHEGIYRRTLMHGLSEGGFERIQQAPFPLYFVASAIPRVMPAVLGIALGLGTYQLEKRFRPRQLHPQLPRRVGFATHVVDARECASPDDLIELILSSSSTPPFTRRGRHRDRRLLDGSLIDNAPAFLAEREPGVRRSLVLLTRPYPEGSTGLQGNRLYVAPREKLPIKRWDYREAAPVDETLAAGRADAERFEADLQRFLDGPAGRVADEHESL
ncbi:MAG: patatin-like phospholipase family protein [Deltaproteobacteria bacterium]|nr:patatin-like phospholipase family protein [Deltaproteobacteria bacterium]